MRAKAPPQKAILVIALLALVIFAVPPAVADTMITFSGSSGDLAASATFTLSGTILTVVLTNTSTHDVLLPTDVLTGVFFDTTHTLTPVSASLNGSSVVYGSFVNGVGEGWQYESGVLAQGKNSGISSTGLGIFGPSGNFGTPGVQLDGLNYGILSAGDNFATGNTGVTGHGPLIWNSIQFTLTAEPSFSLSELGDSVVFQYGTATNDPHFLGVPEPTSMLLFGSGLLAVAGVVRRKLHN